MQFCSEIILVISVELALRAFLIWNHASVISDQLLTSYWSDFNKILTTKNIDVRFCSEHPEWCQKTDCPLNHDNEHPRPFFYWSPSPRVNYRQSWTNKWKIKTPLPLPSPRGFILDLGVEGGGGGELLFYFILSKIGTGNRPHKQKPFTESVKIIWLRDRSEMLGCYTDWRWNVGMFYSFKASESLAFSPILFDLSGNMANVWINFPRSHDETHKTFAPEVKNGAKFFPFSLWEWNSTWFGWKLSASRVFSWTR